MKDNCEECNKIKCRGCGWEPNSVELGLVQSGVITSCPVCNWVPGTPS